MGKVIEQGFSGRGLHFYGMDSTRVLQDVASVDEALTLSGLNWKVNKIPAGYNDGDGNFVPAGKKFHMTQRMDSGEILGQVGAQYTVFDNDQAFAFVDELLGFDTEFHAAGAYGGATVFLIAKLPNGISVEGEPEMDLYLDMINSHDGSGSISCYVTPIRRICENQTRLMISNAVSSVKIRHTSSASERVAQAAQTLKLVDTYKKELEVGINQLQAIEMNLEEVESFLKEWSTSERVVKNVLNTYNESELLPQRGTAWSVINAVTEAQLHHPTRKTSGESRFSSALNGPNQHAVASASQMLLRRVR